MPINYPTYSDPWIEMSVENAQIFVQSFLDQWQTNSLLYYQNTKAVYTPESNMIMANTALGDFVSDPTAYTNFIFIGYIYFADTTTDRLKISDGSTNLFTFNGSGLPVSKGYYPVIFNAIDSIPSFYTAFLGYKFNVVVPKQNKIVAQFTTLPGTSNAGFEVLTQGFNPVTVNWGDGNTITYGLSGIAGAGVMGLYNYANPGLYTITVYCDETPYGYYMDNNDYGTWCTDIQLYNTVGLTCFPAPYQELSEDTINNILIELDKTTNVYDSIYNVNLETNGGLTPPTGEGLAAKNRLISRGWNINTD